MVFLQSLLYLFYLTSNCWGAPCIGMYMGEDSFVCICNSTYCDDLKAPKYTPSGKLLIYSSNQDRFRYYKETTIFNSSQMVPHFPDGGGAIFKIDQNVPFQRIVGFGGAFTDATGINLINLSEGARENVLRSYFSEDGAAYSLCRVPIGGTDFSLRPYTYRDPTESNALPPFTLQEEDHRLKLPFIKRALELRGKRPLKLFASPWSAPAGMKTSELIHGMGFLKDDFYDEWASYFIDFLVAYQKHGIKFWAITTQNEPTKGVIPFFPFNCMGWTPEQQGKFVANYLGPSLAQSNFSYVKIIILDDDRMAIPLWAAPVLNYPGVRDHVWGLGLHWYFNWITPSFVLDYAKQLFPDKELLATEACEGFISFQHVLMGSWKRAESYAQDIIENLNHWVTGWVDWNMALNATGGPNWAGLGADSPIIVNGTADEFYKQPMFYAMAHFSKFVLPGSIRIGSIFAFEGLPLEGVAVRRPDGAIAAIILNKNYRDIPVVFQDPQRGIARFTSYARSIQSILYW